MKIRGFRIEPGEIEATLGHYPDVRQVVVKLREYVSGDKRLVAYVVAGNRMPPRIADIRAYAEQKLPSYMVPAAFVFLDDLPLTPNGKVDRNALPDPETVPARDECNYVEARTPLEQSLVHIWQEVLGLSHISAGTDFYHVGGHSLAAMRIVSRVRTELGIPLTVADIFQTRTIERLAGLFHGAEDVARPIAQSSIDVARRDGTMDVSPSQERLWFFEQLERSGRAYYELLGYRLSGPVDATILEQCFDELIRRHEVLRTTYREQDGRACQQVQSPWKFYLPQSDLCTA